MEPVQKYCIFQSFSEVYEIRVAVEAKSLIFASDKLRMRMILSPTTTHGHIKL